MRLFLFFLFTVFVSTCVPAQTYETLALEAYLHNDLERWEKALAATRSITDEEKRLLTRAEYQLGRAYAAMATQDEDVRDEAMDGVDDALDALWEVNDKNGTAHGIYSGLLGLKIARTPITGMIHGSRAAKYASKAVKLAPHDPAALYHAAANLYYTPEQWGGDSEQALAYLLQALELYGEGRETNWRYLNTLALLGQVQARLGQTDHARATYRTALEAQPDFGYVSNVLLPKLDK